MVFSQVLRLAVLVGLVVSLGTSLGTVGPCGHCDRGLPCPRIDLSATADDHGCCSSSDSASSGGHSLGSARCECGGDPPPAVTAGGPAPVGPLLAEAPAGESNLPAAGSQHASAASRRPPAPPPTPPVFLLDCAFLI
jgi:hypothetical protein